MTRFAIETDWAEYGGPDRPELRATYANLTIRAGEDVVTAVHRRNSQTMCESILVSLYPLAEWFAGNWWFLTEESEVPGRHDFLDRHCLNRARSGYCLPDLRLKPEGDTFLLEWHRFGYTHAPLEFTNTGHARFAKQEVSDVLRDFVDRVEERLTMSGITDTWLQKEWKAIREIDADEAQSEFCRAAAWVGRDPFDISPLESETLIEAAHSLPDEVAEDVLRASRFDQLAEVSRWIQKELAAVGSSYAIDPRLCALRTPAPSSSSANPWAIGYELAAQVRAAIPELATLPVQLENVFDGHLPVVTVPSPPDTIDGLVIFDGGLVCRTAKRRSVSQRFLAARTVFDFLSLHQDKSLLTAARTTKQSEGRAFAAELLAPADELRARLKSPWSTYEELSDVAEELQVSEWVVVHQVQNHRIAKIADMMT